MKENLEEIRELLFVIDMNNGFCNKGNLADSSIKEIVPYIIEWINEFKGRKDAEIVEVNDRHNKDSVELKRYDRHCDNSIESRTIDELIEHLKVSRKFYKNSTCALFAPGMMDYLMKLINLERVVIVGCCTDICVQNFAIALRNFFDELNMEVEIVVPEGAVDTFNIPGVHERTEVNNLAYREMERNGIKLVKKLEKRNGEK